MARILITGVDSFTGQHLAPVLAGAGHEVHGIVRFAPPAGTPGQPHVHQVHACELLDADALRQVVLSVQPHKVVHLAAITHVAHGDAEAIYRTNIVGTRHLLAALAAGAERPTAVLLASSANVYGNATEGVIDESMRPAPANDYAVSKLAMEYMSATWFGQLPITLVRPFNYTGRGQSVDFLLPKIVSHYQRRAPVLELGNLDVERDFSDVRTVVDCYARLLEADATGRIFNVCSGIGHTLRDVLGLAQELTGHAPEVRVNPAFVRANEVRKLVGSPAALQQVIGPIRGPTLRETIRWMLD